jgi:hypothetical protein
MNPITRYIALARDIGIALALGFLVWKIFSAGEDKVKASDLKSLQAQITQQGTILDGWRQESTHANAQLSQDLATLRTPPAVPKPPVWLCDDPARSAETVLPAPASEAGSAHPAPGGTDEGRRRDIRPQIEAFKLKYETALAECRAEDAQWPQ